jgi:hypothetical protein
MRAHACSVVRRQLSAYHDGELKIEEQIALEAHLRECAACRAEAQELRDLSGLIRAGVASRTVAAPDAAFASNIVSRMKAERAESFTGQTQRLFDDLHLVWAALGATGATVACLAIVFTLFYFATRERPDSLGAMIATLSQPSGSDQNPMAQLNDSLRLPSAVDSAFPEAVINEEDAVFALAAVVTREGSIKNLNLLHGSDGTGPAMSRRERQEVESLLDTISKARFEPARYGNSPVAVNMVWLYAHVNVRGKVPAGSHLQPTSPTMISAVLESGTKAV